MPFRKKISTNPAIIWRYRPQTLTIDFHATGVPDQGRLFAADPQTKHHRRGPDVVQRQEAAENDLGDIRVIRDVLLADHREQNVARAVRPARAEHHRVRAHLPDHVHQPDHLRGDELRVPAGVQEPVDVQEFAGTAADPQRSNEKTFGPVNAANSLLPPPPPRSK